MTGIITVHHRDRPVCHQLVQLANKQPGRYCGDTINDE